MLNYGEQGICIVLKCLPKDYILIAREEEKQYTKRNPYRVIKINIISEGQMDIMCYQMWYSFKRDMHHLYSVLVKNT